MQTLLEAIDVAILAAEKSGALAGVVVPTEVWEQICVERAKLEPDAEEMLHSDVMESERYEPVSPGFYQCRACRKVGTRKSFLRETCDVVFAVARPRKTAET